MVLGFPCGSAGKETACNAGDLGLIPGLERSPGEGKGYPLQYIIYLLIYGCTDWAFSSWPRVGLLFVAVPGHLVAVPSFISEHRLNGTQASVIVVHRLNCSSWWEHPRPGIKPVSLHWHQGSPCGIFKLQHMRSSPPARDRTVVRCTRSTES